MKKPLLVVAHNNNCITHAHNNRQTFLLKSARLHQESSKESGIQGTELK